jgi:hypothetical protein
VKLIIDLIPAKHNMAKDLHQSKKIIADLNMNYEKIDVCERNYMLFLKEHKDDIECMHWGLVDNFQILIALYFDMRI